MTFGRSHTETHVCTVCNGTGLQTHDGMYAQEHFADMSEEENWIYQGENADEIYCEACDGKGYIVVKQVQVDGEDLRVMEEVY